jgi:outer membrane protein
MNQSLALKMMSRIAAPATLIVLVTSPLAAETLRVDADEAVRLAVESSHLVVSADARLSAREAAVAAADAARMPEVATTAIVSQRSAVPELSVPLGGPDTEPQTIFPNIETTYLAELSVSQPLYAGGAIESGRTSARHELDAATADRQRTLADLRLLARRDYWQAAASAATVDAAKAQESRAQRLLDDAVSLREAGMAVDADVLAAQARVAAARVHVLRAETAARNDLAALRSLIGRGRDTTLELADRTALSTPPSPADVDSLIESALGLRPELAAADARIAALQAHERVVDAARRPSLAVTGQWDLARPNNRYLPLEDTWNDSWSVGLMAHWTVFDGDRTRSQTAVVRSQQAASRADRDELARRIALDVETARLDLQSALDAIPAADASRAAAAAREEASSERHAAGLAPIQEMLDAQAELASAEVEQIQTRAAAWIARAAVDRAIGR